MSDFWQPTDSAFIANPQPYYEKVRRQGAIFKAKTGDFVLLGYRACKDVLSDPSCITGLQAKRLQKIAEYASDRDLELEHISKLIKGMVIQLNDPIHKGTRFELAKAWPAPQSIKTLAAKVIQKRVDALPDSFEAMNSLCKTIPVNIIASILGFSPDMAMTYVADGLKVVQALDPYYSLRDLSEIAHSAYQLHGFVTKTVASPDFEPTRLAQAILRLGEANDELSDTALFAFLFIAGFETTSTLLATCLYHLIENPDVVAKVKAYGASTFVREILRIHSPVQITGRETTKELTIEDTPIPAGSVLTLCLGAANTDPRQFENPLEINWTCRQDLLSFGYGLHHCLGRQLAEIEATQFVEALLPQISGMQVTKGPIYENKFAVRSIQSMQIALQ